TKNVIPLLNQITLLRLIMPLVSFLRYGAPERQLGLHIYAEQICGFESGFRRAAGMEAVMVNAVRLRDAENAKPLFRRRGSISRQREDQAVMFAPQNRLRSVDCELVVFRLELPRSRQARPRIQQSAAVADKAQLQLVEIRLGIAP